MTERPINPKFEEMLEAARRGDRVMVTCQTYNDAVSLRSTLLEYIEYVRFFYRTDKDLKYERSDPRYGTTPYDDLAISIKGKIITIKKGERYEVLVVPASPPQASG